MFEFFKKVKKAYASSKLWNDAIDSCSAGDYVRAASDLDELEGILPDRSQIHAFRCFLLFLKGEMPKAAEAAMAAFDQVKTDQRLNEDERNFLLRKLGNIVLASEIKIGSSRMNEMLSAKHDESKVRRSFRSLFQNI